MNDQRKAPVTMEDLLRLKRVERPSPEFWTQFESELRAKQLAAIVEKRPWWCSVPRLYVLVLRHRRSLASAGAMLAVGAVGFHAYRVSQPVHAASFGPMAYATPAETALPVAVVANGDKLSAAAAAIVSSATPTREIAEASRPALRATAASLIQSLPMVTLIDDVPEGASTERFATDSLSHSMAADLASAQASASQVARGLLDDPHSFETRLVPAARAVVAEPLAQMASPAEERRSRLLAEVFPAGSEPAATAAFASERQVSRLSDDRFDSSVSRYDLDTESKMIGVSFKF